MKNLNYNGTHNTMEKEDDGWLKKGFKIIQRTEIAQCPQTLQQN